MSKVYGDVLALDDVSLTIEPGRFHLLAGPNGSGKSTLLGLLLGLESPTDGTVSVPDVTVGAGFQRPTFYPDLSVQTNLDVFGELVDATPDWQETLVDELELDRVAHRNGSALSGGYAKKLDIALALLGQPDVVLLDEPLGDLDDVTRSRVVDFLDQYSTDGRTVLVSSHRMTAFEPGIDALTVLDRGRLALDVADAELDAAISGARSLRSLYVECLSDDRPRRVAPERGSTGGPG